MACLSAAQAAMYLVSALLLKATSGYPFPLLPVAAWIAALTLVQFATNWRTRNKVFILLGNATVGLANFGLGVLCPHRRGDPRLGLAPNRWPAIFDFPLSVYALMAVIGLASFAAAVAGVARQRRGDSPAAIPWTAGSAGYPDWVRNLLRFPCPTSSATRAQVWFDLKTSGLVVLTIGVVLAMVNPLLFAVSVPVAFVRPAAVMCGMFSVVAVLVFAGNAFGIRTRQGRSFASAFEATQPYASASLAGLKVLVRSVCVLAALAAIGASVSASMSFIAVGEGGAPLPLYEPLRSWLRAIEIGVGALTGTSSSRWRSSRSSGHRHGGLARGVGGACDTLPRSRGPPGLVGAAPCSRARPAGADRIPRVGSVALWEFLLDALVWVTRWIDTPAIVLATAYVVWKAFAERLLTLRQACAAVLVSAAFGAAWLTMLRAAGMSLGEMHATEAVWVLSPMLLPLMASVWHPGHSIAFAIREDDRRRVTRPTHRKGERDEESMDGCRVSSAQAS